MDSFDLVSYLYICFEQDNIVSGADEYKSKSQLRKSFHKQFMPDSYYWTEDEPEDEYATTTYGGDLDPDTPLEPGTTVQLQHKEYEEAAEGIDVDTGLGAGFDEPLG